MRDKTIRRGRQALGLLVALVCCGGVRAEPRTVPWWAPDPTPRTVVYEVADLLHRPGGWTGYDSLDKVSRTIIDSTGTKHWLADEKGAWTLRELDGSRLEITAPAKAHEEIRDVLENLRRINDRAVTMNAQLIEIDAADYDKFLRPVLATLGRRGPDGPAAGPITFKAFETLGKKGKVIRSADITLANGREGTYLSVRNVFSYVRWTDGPGGKKPDEYRVAATGMTLRATAVVSPDCRSMRLKLIEQAVDLHGFEKKQEFRGEDFVEVNVPDLVETTTSVTVNNVEDGQSLLVSVGHLPKATKDRGRVLVLLVQPRIFIRAEQEAQGNNPK
jgi:hypothetical protein